VSGVEAWLVEHATAVMVSLAIITALVGFVKFVMPKVRQLGHLIDDLAGEPARQGVPARPGLMERMATVEDYTKANTLDRQMLARVEHKVDEAARKAEEAARLAAGAANRVHSLEARIAEYRDASNAASRDKAATWEAMGDALRADPPPTATT
jgi:hypothetical protein